MGVLARVVGLIVGIVVLIIVAGIVLVLFKANATNTIVSDVHDAARWLAGPFDGIFSFHNANTATAVNCRSRSLRRAFLGTPVRCPRASRINQLVGRGPPAVAVGGGVTAFPTDDDSVLLPLVYRYPGSASQRTPADDRPLTGWRSGGSLRELTSGCVRTSKAIPPRFRPAGSARPRCRLCDRATRGSREGEYTRAGARRLTPKMSRLRAKAHDSGCTAIVARVVWLLCPVIQLSVSV